MPEKAIDLSDLAARVEYLERQNRLLKRAMAVLFALVGIALILMEVGFKEQQEGRGEPRDGRPPAEQVEGADEGETPEN